MQSQNTKCVSWVWTFHFATEGDKIYSCLKAHVFHVSFSFASLLRPVWLQQAQLHHHVYSPLSIFGFVSFKGQHLNLLEYHVPRSEGCLSELFRVLENYKAFLQIKHYSISQTTLEQVFSSFSAVLDHLRSIQ